MTQYVLTFMSGPEDGQVEVFDALPIGMGRGLENPLVIPCDDQVSRRHCVVREEQGQFVVEDLQSTNGTYVGGARLIGESAHLAPGELFRVGRTWLELTTFEAEETHAHHARIGESLPAESLAGVEIADAG